MSKGVESSAPINLTVRFTATVGIITGVLMALVATMAFASEGSAPFDHSGTTYLRVAILYPGVGMVAGALVGLLWPLARTAARCYLAALPAAAAIAAGIMLLQTDSGRTWSESDWWLFGVLLTVATLVVGNTMNVHRMKAQTMRRES